MRMIMNLAINSFALAVVSYLVPEFMFASIYALIVAAVVIGIINTFIKPILQLIALPISVVTFGVAAFLINVLLLWFASVIVPGFSISSFYTAVISSLLLTLVSWFLHRLESKEG